jgi:hypothetical protein
MLLFIVAVTSSVFQVDPEAPVKTIQFKVIRPQRSPNISPAQNYRRQNGRPSGEIIPKTAITASSPISAPVGPAYFDNLAGLGKV